MGFIYFVVTHLTLCYIVPLLIIIVSYGFICHRIWKRQMLGSQPTNEVDERARQLERSKFRGLRMIAAVVAAFAFTWLPFYATFTRIKLANAFTGGVLLTETEVNLWYYVIPINQWLSSANSCINPFLYHFMDSKFRFHFRQMICGPHQQRRAEAAAVNQRRQPPSGTSQSRKMTRSSSPRHPTKSDDVINKFPLPKNLPSPQRMCTNE